MAPPRFILVLSHESNLLCATLVTRELKSVASARQTFQLIPSEDGTQAFDPAEVWYKMKKVIAACLDIGRTLPREVAGVAIVGDANVCVEWKQEGDEVVSSGRIQPQSSDAAPALAQLGLRDSVEYSGTLARWLWWNLTGGIGDSQENAHGNTLVRAPFDAELPILAVIESAGSGFSRGAGSDTVTNDWILEASAVGWQRVDSAIRMEINSARTSQPE